MDRSIYLNTDPEGHFEEVVPVVTKWYHEAKVLYFGGKPLAEISAILGCNEAHLKMLALGTDLTGRESTCWYYERKTVDTSAGKIWLKKAIEDKGAVVESIVADGADILRTGLLKLKEAQAEGTVLTPRQLKEVSSIILDMDKIARLESGKATEIIQNAGLSPEQIRSVLLNDPFLRKPKDIDVEVVK